MIKLSAFSDEACDGLPGQIQAMLENNIYMTELRAIDGINVKDMTEEMARDYARQLADAGISVSAIGSPLGKVSIDTDMEAYEAVIRHVCRLANIFGTNRIRVFSFFEAYGARDRVIAAMQRMVDIAAEYGLTMFHENEKDIYGDTADRVLDLHASVRGLKFIYDPANFLQIGESAKRTLTEILPLCGHFHIKDYDTASGELVPAGMGSGEIGAVIDSIEGDAVLVLEPHLKVFSGYADIDGEPMKHRFDFETNRQAFDFAAKALAALLEAHGYTATKGGYVK
jgi:sugar phosphate isomerase/epimerase